MSLGVLLRLSISTISRLKAVIQTEVLYDFLVTQSEENISTQDGSFIIVPHVLVLYSILTQDELVIITQDDRIVKAVA